MEDLSWIKEGYRELIEEYVGKLKRLENVLGILLFGSVARGSCAPFALKASDIDLLIVADKLPPNLLDRKAMSLQLRGTPLIQDIWVTPEELLDLIDGRAGFIMDALTEGYILYDEAGILRESKRYLKELMEKKKIVRWKGGWRWTGRGLGSVFEL